MKKPIQIFFELLVVFIHTEGMERFNFLFFIFHFYKGWKFRTLQWLEGDFLWSTDNSEEAFITFV